MSEEPYTKKVSLSIPFSTAETATLAYDVLSVDKEIKGSGVRREILSKDLNLIVNFYSNDLKRLRVAVNSIIKNIILIIKTIEQFETI